MTAPLGALVLAAAVAAGGSSVEFRLQDSDIEESSGLVASTVQDGVYWTHNDSGDSSRIFALDGDGETIGVWRLDVADARDWEAMTADAKGRLWIGDIGDNDGVRDNGILVHRVTEPTDPSGGGTLRGQSFRLRYPDEPQDAEAMFFAGGRLHVVSKGFLGGRVFRAPAALDPDEPTVLEPVDDAPPLVTDAGSLDGGRYVLRDYSTLYVYSRDGELETTVDLPGQQQGESLAVIEGGRAVLVGSEGERSPVFRVPLPPAPKPTPSASAGSPPDEGSNPPVAQGGSSADLDTIRKIGYAAAGLFVLAVLLLGSLAIRALTRRR